MGIDQISGLPPEAQAEMQKMEDAKMSEKEGNLKARLIEEGSKLDKEIMELKRERMYVNGRFENKIDTFGTQYDKNSEGDVQKMNRLYDERANATREIAGRINNLQERYREVAEELIEEMKLPHLSSVYSGHPSYFVLGEIPAEIDLKKTRVSDERKGYSPYLKEDGKILKIDGLTFILSSHIEKLLDVILMRRDNEEGEKLGK